MHQPLINKGPFYQQLGLIVIKSSQSASRPPALWELKNDARARSFAGFAKNGYSHLPRSTPYVVFSYRIFILAFAIYYALPRLFICCSHPLADFPLCSCCCFPAITVGPGKETRTKKCSNNATNYLLPVLPFPNDQK